MRAKIIEIIDFNTVNTLLEGFNRSTGFVTAILDLDGNVLSKSGWRQICTEFHRVNPDSAKRCTISDTVLANKINEGETYHFYKCLNGLVDVAVPIVIKGEHVANLFTGQFFFEKPDISFFKKQAEKYAFEKNAYLEALRQVPVVSKEKVRKVMDFLLNMTLMISETAFQNLELKELNEARKKNELVLKESEERFRKLHNASFGGIAIHDKGLILECNKGLSDITGYGYDELIGMDGLSLIAQDSRQQVRQHINAGYENPYEANGIRKNGDIYPLRLEARNIPYKGKCVRVVEFRDITATKKAEKEKEDLEAQLRQAQKIEAVGRLAGGVAHDFNNMLSVIIGHAEMALEELDPTLPLYTELEEIKKAGERSADLTRQLLAFARKQNISPKVIDLNETLSGMTRMLERLIGEDIDLVWLPGDNIWPVKIDPSQIDQILANLCVNARDAIEDIGKVTIETNNIQFDKTYCADHIGFLPGEYILLAVSDTGCGIGEKDMDNLFDPFFTTKENGKGTGLGLATVYGIVKQNKGFVNVYSEPGYGSTFKIYFPRHKIETPRLSEKKGTRPDATGQETILLVEDEPGILRMTTMMLEKLGYRVLPAKTPGEAISLAQEYIGEIQLLVTDVIMPEMNGRDLAEKIIAFYPGLKRLFMSGYTANVIAHHGVLDDGVNFIPKPFTRKSLAAKVREVLDKKNSSP